MVKKSMDVKNSRKHISNNVLGAILLVVIFLSLLTIGVSFISSDSKVSGQAIQIPSGDAATGIVTLKIISNPEDKKVLGGNDK